jgi:hypothetical protein
VHDFIPLIIASFWPITVLVLAFGFRKGIRDLIKSVLRLKIGSVVVFEWGQASIDRDRDDESKTLEGGPVPKQIAASSMEKGKPANWFWLGSDLETTAQRTLRGAPKGKIIGGLTQISHHMSEVGLGDTGPARQVSLLKSEVERLSEPDLVREWRNSFAERIRSIIHEVSGLAKAQQPDFKANPDPR